MIGKNLKITTKLTISAAAFLLPILVMLFLIISVSLVSIRKDRSELKGIECLRPAVSLMQIVPQFIKLSVDEVSADPQHVKQNAAELLDDLRIKYESGFGKAPRALSENWNAISSGGGSWEQKLILYAQFMSDLRSLVLHLGDASGLVTDSELESNYLALLSVKELPKVQERTAAIANLFRVLESGGFTEELRSDLERHLLLFLYSDHTRVQSDFDSVKAISARNIEAWQVFEGLLKAYNNAVLNIDNALEFVIKTNDAAPLPQIDESTIAVLKESVGRINNSAYRLQTVSLDRLEQLIVTRIQVYERHLVRSLVLAGAAAAAAFFITIVTAANIRKSTRMVDHIFQSLEKNDLSVRVENFSRDELGELLIALGGFLEKLKKAFVSFNQNAAMVTNAVYDLSSSAKEITTTANEQSASVAEIVSTMEKSMNLSGQIAAKTVEVADLAAQTRELSMRGAELRDANEDMMLGIHEQNAKIIDEINNLADMLSRIDESVQLIDTIADQTKLIAFNAALEASSSGEAGARFSVVAGEIRRFADNVVDSVVEIKDKISEVQRASQALVSEANNGTRQIDAGYDRMVEQKEVFENIVNISQNVATRSQQISNLSKQQELASAQIFTALKEISAGVKQFVGATASTSATADNLNSMSAALKETLAKYQTAE